MIGSYVIFQSFDGSVDYAINDQASSDLAFSIAPYFYIRLDEGGPGSTDISTESHPIPHAPGEKSGDTYRRGRGITLSGSIIADSISHLEAGAEYLEEMFWDTRPRKLYWTPIGSTDGNAYIICYVLNDLAISRNIPQTLTLPTWTWTVGLRADNPQIFKYVDDTVYYSWMS
jgi:hypothetical protein